MSAAMTMDALKRERDRFVAFAFAAADMLMEIDGDGNICFADGATSGLLGHSPQSLIGQPFHNMIVSSDQPVARNLLEAIRTRQRLDNVALSFHTTLRSEPVQTATSAFHFGDAGSTFLSISQRRTSQADEALRTRDMQTGFLQKEAFAEQANERIRLSAENGEKLELTLFDLPQLQDILSGLDPEQARRLMQEIGDYLRSKSVGDGLATTLEEGSSYGLLHDGSMSADELLFGIRARVAQIDPAHSDMSATACSVAAEPTSLTRQDSANAILYTLNKFAQTHGENFTIESLSGSYKEMLQDTVSRIASFRDVLSDEAFDIAFQPIVDIKSGLIHHFESLVRLKDKASDDFASPFHFISFGESAGLINDFDLLMTQKTLDMLLQANAQGNKPMVAVNISGRSLSSSLFMDSFAKLVASEPKVRQQLILEITESSKIDDMKVANAFVQEMRGAGNLVCLDDFGTGESSFDYLRSLQVDFIKIDGSYVKESMQTRHGREMLKAMAGLCRTLGVTTIGEMVEDEKAAALLWECGIKFGQGYFFGKPTIDAQTLAACNQRTPFYKGIVRAKRFRTPDDNRPNWRRDSN